MMVTNHCKTNMLKITDVECAHNVVGFLFVQSQVNFLCCLRYFLLSQFVCLWYTTVQRSVDLPKLLNNFLQPVFFSLSGSNTSSNIWNVHLLHIINSIVPVEPMYSHSHSHCIFHMSWGRGPYKIHAKHSYTESPKIIIKKKSKTKNYFKETRRNKKKRKSTKKR